VIVHVLTHSVVESGPQSIYSDVAEHLDNVRALGRVDAQAIHHGELPLPPQGTHLELDVEERLAWIQVVDQGLTPVELRVLATQAIEMASTLEGLS
jgi:hypothetical protein